MIPLAAFVALAACVAFFGFVFGTLAESYTESVTAQSAQSMSELSKQVSAGVNNTINDRLTAINTLAKSLAYTDFRDRDEVTSYLQTFKEEWGALDVFLYTEDGQSINQNDEHLPINAVLQLLTQANRDGSVVSVLKSDISIFVPVRGNRMVGGSRIAATSIYFSVNNLLVDSDISSYGGSGRVYLIKKDGSIICKLVPESDPYIYNVLSFYDRAKYECLDGSYQTLSAALQADRESVSLITPTDGGNRVYASICPIQSSDKDWTVLYTVPESVLNSHSKSFSATVTTHGVVLMAILALVLVVSFGAWLFRYSKRMNRAIVRRDLMFRQLVTKTKYAFALLAADGEAPSYISPNAGQFLGGGTPRLTKKESGFLWSLPGGSSDDAFAQFNERLAAWDGTGDFFSGHIRYTTAESSEQYYVIQLCRTDDMDEYICVFQDVTEEHRRNLALQAAIKSAQQASNAKTRFLANMSHDIRTPMNAILSMAHFAKDEPDKAQEYLDTIIVSAEHLRDLVNNILDISRLESEQLKIDAVPVSITGEIDKIRQVVLPLFDAKGQKLSFSVRVTHDKVQVDWQKVKQILVNLLNNASKFTRNGGSVQMLIRESAAFARGFAAYTVTVKDNGIGMSKTTQDSIFQPFTRAENDSVKKTEGTGLGLAIVKSYADLMGATVQVDSEEGRGSTFTVRFTFRILDDNTVLSPEADPQEAPADLTGMKILVAEDDHINQVIIRKILEPLGVDCVIAGDGQELLDLLDRSEPGQYDAVFMDIMMPMKDGLQATRELRRNPRADLARLPVIALSANAFVEDRQKSLQAGMNEHLAKPVESDQILAVLSKVKRGAFAPQDKE